MRVDLDENVIVLETSLRAKIANFIGDAAVAGVTVDGTRIACSITDEDRELALRVDGR